MSLNLALKGNTTLAQEEELVSKTTRLQGLSFKVIFTIKVLCLLKKMFMGHCLESLLKSLLGYLVNEEPHWR